MVLYLVQHADSKKEEEDPARPLSDEGLRDIRKVASHLSRFSLRVGAVFHSPKLRAKQTAEVLSEWLHPSEGCLESGGLAPLDDPGEWAGRLAGETRDLMLVGHLPHLARLASRLLCGDAERPVVAFSRAGVANLARDASGSWSLRWMVTPEVLPEP